MWSLATHNRGDGGYLLDWSDVGQVPASLTFLDLVDSNNRCTTCIIVISSSSGSGEIISWGCGSSYLLRSMRFTLLIIMIGFLNVLYQKKHT